MQIIQASRRSAPRLLGLGVTPVAYGPDIAAFLLSPRTEATNLFRNDFDFVRRHFALGGTLTDFMAQPALKAKFPSGAIEVIPALKSLLGQDIQKAFWALSRLTIDKVKAAIDPKIRAAQAELDRMKKIIDKGGYGGATGKSRAEDDYRRAKDQLNLLGESKNKIESDVGPAVLGYLQKVAALNTVWKTNLDKFNVEFASIPLTLEGIETLKTFIPRIKAEAEKGNITAAAAADLIGKVEARIKEIQKPPAEQRQDAELLLLAESMDLAQLLATIAKAPADLADQLQEVYDRRKAAADKKANEEKQQKNRLYMFAGVGLVAALIIYSRLKKSA
jgi:hypothetical protein